MAKERVSTFDVLKGLCILMVIFTHYQWTAAQNLRYLFPFWLDMAIPLCILMSGYLFSKSYQRRIADSTHPGFRLIEGSVEWGIRFTIPYIVACAAELAFMVALEDYETGTSLSLPMTFLTGGVGPGSYYYPILLQLAFFAPFVFVLIRKFGGTGLLICCAVNVFFELLKWKVGMSSWIYRIHAVRYMMLFAFGFYFAQGGRLSRAQSICMVVIGLISVYMNSYKNITLFFITYWRTTSFITTLHIIPLFYWLLDKPLKCGILERIGRASYNIYLVQMIYYQYRSGWLYSIITQPICQLVFNLVICVCVGLLFYAVETPITRYVIKQYRKTLSAICVKNLGENV